MITLRPAIEADCTKLATLAMQVWLHTYAKRGISQAIANFVLAELTPEKYAARLSDPDSHLTVAEHDGNLVGIVRTHRHPPWAEATPGQGQIELATLYVQEHFARQGIGTQLLTFAQQRSAQYSKEPLWLTVNVHNANAIAFYHKMGFRKIGTTFFSMEDGEHENHVLLGPQIS